MEAPGEFCVLTRLVWKRFMKTGNSLIGDRIY